MSETDKPLWQEIISSLLLDNLYTNPLHHIDDKKVILIGDYKKYLAKMLSEMENRTNQNNIRTWLKSLTNKLDKLKDPEGKNDFLLSLNFLSDRNVDTQFRKKFSTELFQFVINKNYKPPNSFFKVLVVDDYFVFNIPIFIVAARNLTGKKSGVPIIHFDFECIPENAINRCKEEKYDLILLDIDFGLLDLDNIDKTNKQFIHNRKALEIARVANEQLPKIPIVVFSKYEDVHYYEGLLSNVIGKIIKEDIRKEIREKKLEWKRIINENFINPLLDYLLNYYKVKVYFYGDNLILRSLPDSSIQRIGIYEKVEFPNQIELPSNLQLISDDMLINILKKDEKSLYGYSLIPFITFEKLNLYILCCLPECMIDYDYLTPIQLRIKNHYKEGISKAEKFQDHILNFNKSLWKYQSFCIQLNYETFLGKKWDFWDKSIENRLVSLIDRDLRYIVNPEFTKQSLLDILGPIMIGPSSSHTAGANRIGRLARNFAELLIDNKKEINKITVEMLNSFSTTGEGHGSNKAIAAGLLGLQQYDWLLAEVLTDPKRNGENKIKSKEELKRIDNTREIIGSSSKERHINVKNIDIEVEFNWPNKIDTTLHKKFWSNAIRIKFKGENENEHELIAFSRGGGNIMLGSIKIDGEPEPYKFEDKELDEKNGKKDIVLDSFGKIKKIYENPFDEIVNVIKQIDKDFKIINETSDEFKDIIAKPPFFLNLADLIVENELWKIALNYELWYWQNFSNTSKNDYDHKPMNPEDIFSIFRSYYFLIDKIAKESLQKELSSATSYNNNYGYNLWKAYEKSIKENRDYSKIAMAYAIGVNEINAKMKLPILAAPTAGSCGVIPGVLMALQEYLKSNNFDDKKIENLLTKGLLVSALIGLVITNIVPPAGATHGCQAEIGTAGAMASGMATFVLMTKENNKNIKEINEAVVNAAALSLDNSLGLICDPIGGRVEYPCIQRAGDKAAESIDIAFKVVAGVKSKISPSDIVWVMKKVGEDMLPIYKETSRGPYANSPSSC